MKKLLNIMFLLLLSASLLAQENEQKLIQFVGKIFSDKGEPMPYVNVVNRSKNLIASSNFEGIFNIIAGEGDQIEISFVGYKTQHYQIPSGLEGNKYSVVIKMYSDTVVLPQTTVLPWPSIRDFPDAFMGLDMENEKDRLEQSASGFYRLDHKVEPVKASPINNPTSAIYQAVQKNKAKNNKGNLSPDMQRSMIKDFFKEGFEAVPDSIFQQYHD